MQQRNIILFITILLIASSVLLFAVSEKNMDPNYKKNWWVVYFENPADNSLNFTIENHSDKNNFHWEISVDNQKINEGNIDIQKGSAWTSDVQASDYAGKKVIIRASDGENKKEIYKNL